MPRPQSAKPYRLSATKLVTYQQCPQAYSFRYERKLKVPPGNGSTALGNALHRALAIAYKDWHYTDHIPSLKWFEDSWTLSAASAAKLSRRQIEDGLSILQDYYKAFVEPLAVMPRPLGVERWIKATVQFGKIEFALEGRYDRLDQLDGSLELIDYKTTKNAATPDSMDVQLGLYSIALEQVYQQSLKRVTLIFLRTGETLSFDVNDAHREAVRSLIADLATKLWADDEWMPKVGGHCDRCGFAKYCAAKTPKPEPLPEGGRKLKQVQLTLAI
jgi:putative RecB family exonuclease